MKIALGKHPDKCTFVLSEERVVTVSLEQVDSVRVVLGEQRVDIACIAGVWTASHSEGVSAVPEPSVAG